MHPIDAYNEFVDDTLNDEEKLQRKQDIENL